MNKRFTEVIAPIVSLVMSIGGLIAAFANPQSKTITLAFAIVMFGLLGWFIYQRFKRRQQFRRTIASSENNRNRIGFNAGISYSEADSERFYGRAIDINAIASQIQNPNFQYGVLYGQSGVGKSSIIEAGLKKHLGDTFQCVSVSMNGIPQTTPKEQSAPNKLTEFLLIKLAHKIDMDIKAKSFNDLLATLNQKPMLLFIDQFEQVFDYTKYEERSAFAKELCDACERSGERLKIMILVRKDYYGDICPLFELNRQNAYLLHKFNEIQAREVIRRSCNLDPKLEHNESDHPLLDFEDTILEDL